MRSWLFKLMCLFLIPQILSAGDGGSCLPARKGVAAAHSSADAAGLSMMLWGTGIAVGIATLTGLLRQSKSSSGSGSHSH
jgi:hypothetical protein